MRTRYLLVAWLLWLSRWTPALTGRMRWRMFRWSLVWHPNVTPRQRQAALEHWDNIGVIYGFVRRREET